MHPDIHDDVLGFEGIGKLIFVDNDDIIENILVPGISMAEVPFLSGMVHRQLPSMVQHDLPQEGVDFLKRLAKSQHFPGDISKSGNQRANYGLSRVGWRRQPERLDESLDFLHHLVVRNFLDLNVVH